MKTNNVSKIGKSCTGCSSCFDVCPTSSIEMVKNNSGFTVSDVNFEKCVDCGKCYNICPAVKQDKNVSEQKLFAAYAKSGKVRNGGSSGGIFELLATKLLEEGYYVCGAAFDGTVLKHRLINNTDELPPLLKSKYVQSDTKGIYKEITSLLEKGEKVFFCGTPCQVSALKNVAFEKYKGTLILADIICHGVPSQHLFDLYLKSIEDKNGGAVSDFSFRVKDNKHKHAHGFSYTLTKNNEQINVNGVYPYSDYYNAFKNYLIFRESCYSCEYATLERVSDITLADFWGIEKYEFSANTDQGVSMIITNTEVGEALFKKIADNSVYKEFPVQYGIDSNYSLTKKTKMPAEYYDIFSSIEKNGYQKTADKYFVYKGGLKSKLYWKLPASLRNMIRKIRGKLS